MQALNRILIPTVIVADLFAVMYFGGSLILNGTILSHAEHEKIVVEAAKSEAHEGGEAAAAAAPAFDLASYVADPVKGEKVAAKCKACHTFDNGGPNRVGPNQWGIVGAHLGHRTDFAYSGALVEKKASTPVWTEEALHAFLNNPKEFIPGTKMQFNGVRDPKDRADLIAWLKTLK